MGPESPSTGRPTWNCPEKRCNAGYRKISTDKLHSLDSRTLEQRRVDSRLCMLYKIRNNLVAIEEDKHLQRGPGRSHQYRQIRADRDYTRFSFFPWTIIQWNQLPGHMLGNLAWNLQNQCCEDRALQAQLITKIASIALPFSLFSSFYLSLFLLVCLIFFIVPFFPFLHSTSDNPQSWGHTSILIKVSFQSSQNLMLHRHLIKFFCVYRVNQAIFESFRLQCRATTQNYLNQYTTCKCRPVFFFFFFFF